MPTALIVDDSKVDQRLAGKLIEAAPSLGVTVAYADDGKQALQAIAQETPRIVITDLQMPEMDGLELTTAIRKTHPNVPVILMTAHGSEEIAAEALRIGAASSVPKKNLAEDLATTVEHVLELAGAANDIEALTPFKLNIETTFTLGPDSSIIHPVIRYLRHETARLRLCDETAAVRVGVALSEAITNAIDHGNLEVDSKLHEQDADAFYKLLNERRNAEPYKSRTVTVHAHFTPQRAVFTINDQGKGFNAESIPDPTEAENLGKIRGRGVMLMRMFMDHVSYDNNGTQVTLVKEKDR